MTTSIAPTGDSFIRLETICKDKNFAKVVHILYPTAEKPTFKIGRGHDSDVKIADISVSRIHAKITLTPQGFTLEDNDSKFGTLLLLSNLPYEIDFTNGLYVQSSRTTLSISVKPAESLQKVETSPVKSQLSEENKSNTATNSAEKLQE
jgi:pSer/pThr/pTyr-binding forkhead associated (FHA) protein